MRACSGGSTSISLQLHDALLPDYDPEATYLLSIGNQVDIQLIKAPIYPSDTGSTSREGCAAE